LSTALNLTDQTAPLPFKADRLQLRDMAICVLLTLASDSPLLLIISSLGFGGTFMGTTSLVMTIARQLSVPGNLNLLGFVTLIYGIGQILGPALTSMLSNGTSALASATLCGAAALFIAALI
ncbi:YbfB/YjiJ family MFS transporter, partial [Pseudomonas aeruginosa]|uniref:YbfB/YjiJ family MFS transporter n=1 Tax=Pseudomonas aeruginosa TaxID=287 RepID=UPI003CF27C41